MSYVELTARERARFERSIDRSGDCHVWTGTDRHVHGYGYFCLYRSGKRRTHRFLAHRLAFALAHGYWPTGRIVRHRCDNPPCVNPAHLLVGTQAQNMEDAVERGRLDTSGLSAEYDQDCRLCGVQFSGRPSHRYCESCRQIPRWARRRLMAGEVVVCPDCGRGCLSLGVHQARAHRDRGAA